MIYAMLFIDLSILIVSAMMGLLSASFIIIMIAIVLIIGAIWLSNMFQKKSGG
jgi:NADH:ubiquinone oxidoreductase subunit 6 (subunit J)